MSLAQPVRVAVAPLDLVDRLHVLGEIVASLIERVDVLEAQRSLLLRKIECLERPI